MEVEKLDKVPGVRGNMFVSPTKILQFYNGKGQFVDCFWELFEVFSIKGIPEVY